MSGKCDGKEKEITQILTSPNSSKSSKRTYKKETNKRLVHKKPCNNVWNSDDMKNSETKSESCENNKVDSKYDSLSDDHSNSQEQDAETQSSPIREQRLFRFTAEVSIFKLVDELTEPSKSSSNVSYYVCELWTNL